LRENNLAMTDIKGNQGPVTDATSENFSKMSARRVLAIGGIALVAAGMILGDIFAVFVLHQNANRIGEGLSLASNAIVARDAEAVLRHFAGIGGLLENRGTKVDAHVHMIDFGYLALMLAMVLPYAAITERRKKVASKLFLAGAVMLPLSVFLIHYVGLTYSPLESIGWASMTADFGGLLVIVASLLILYGLARSARGVKPSPEGDGPPSLRERTSSVLLTGGILLVLAGFIHGAWYAMVDLRDHEAQDHATLQDIIDRSMAAQAAGAGEPDPAAESIRAYGLLQAEKAVNIAAHSHIIEFGLLAILLAFVQHLVYLSRRWKRIWVITLLTGSVILPVFVLLELQLGLVAGGIADFGGLLVIAALIAMLWGIVRQTGRLDDGAY
jgi:hypothetical protein